MLNKKIITPIILVLIIFSIGFILRIETTDISAVSTIDKAYYQDDNGLPYFYELDSYYNYRLTKNLIDHGYIGDALIDGKQWDSRSYYPPGVPMDYPPLLPYLGALFYKIVNIFGNISLIVTSFWLPAIIGSLAGVVAYLFMRRFTNEYGAFSAGILITLAPYYFIRTVPGWYDTDMFNIIFPLLVVWFFMEALGSNNIKNKMGFTTLAAFSMFLFALAWNGWQYLFYVLVIYSLFYFIWCSIKGREVKKAFYVLMSFITLTITLVFIFSGYLSIINLIFSPLELLTVLGNPWVPYPNIYVMVLELSKPSFEQVISGVGISFFIGILGFICLYRILINEKLKNIFLKKISWFLYSFLILWTITGIALILNGGRFIIMLIPPLVISSGFFMGLVTDYLNLDNKQNILYKFSKFSIPKKSISYLLSVLLVFIILFPALINAYSSNSVLIPIVNDDLNSASIWINNSSNISNDTVIITGWTWGHFYTAQADRPVIFDGRLGYVETLPKRNFDDSYVYGKNSPSASREYWIDKAFSTNNETLSIGIFRMLATSGDYGYLTLDGYTKNTTKSIEILNSILGVDKQTALKILKNNYGFNDFQAQNVLNFSHPTNPRQIILVTNNGMITKGYWIFHFGSWDFNKQKGNDITYSVGQINYTEKISKSTNGVIIDPQTGKITWDDKVPYCVLKVGNNGTEKIYLDRNSNFCIFLLINSNQTVVMDKGLEDSIFTNLFMEKNSRYFKPIFSNKNVTIWKII